MGLHTRAISGFLWILVLGCSEPPLPQIQVTGDAASHVRFSDWSHVRVHGQIVRWEAQFVRVTPEPLGEIEYTLIDDDGETIGTERARVKLDAEPGSPVPATFLAFGGGMLGDDVSRIQISVRSKPRPVQAVRRGPPRLATPGIRP